jgi:hypothetical protein
MLKYKSFYIIRLDTFIQKQDHCLAVTHWSPEFASPDAKVDRTVVWIRFPGLNLVYYDESFLLAMASAIGRPIKVDTNTLKVERGKFARVCVEIDLTVPVVGKIWVNGHWYKIQYEGLHLICTSCGCYGHLGRNCTQTPTTATAEPTGHQSPIVTNHPPPPPQSNPPKDTLNADAGNEKELMTNNIDSQTVQETISNIDEGIKELHGDWLLVTRKKKQTNSSTSHKSNTKNNWSTNQPHTPTHSKTPTPQHKFPPRPKPNEIPRAQNSSTDPKRRRQDDHTPSLSITKDPHKKPTDFKLPPKDHVTQITMTPPIPKTPQPTILLHVAKPDSLNNKHHTQDTRDGLPHQKLKPVIDNPCNSNKNNVMNEQNNTGDTHMNASDSNDNTNSSSTLGEAMVT